ncbi:GDSL esterase/lipase 6 [Selaginella moellendorffii]|uniref:GDSL esterase/lipase 6 n=1 Tax=Selaginella moellendorffii TaxID=88036 RepID=UPI000D1C3290|nr:GDSL esterase/lipase 6 [Selaginella moellendorffii]|eukprot:XP_002982393.2 GDSL esterase/lipase 6 [Selaginella moellendorffii]
MRILVFVLAILALCACVFGRSIPQLRTIYMGDSIFDVGTNKYVKNSVSRCDFVPYGETQYAKPSGRCSDGFIIPDLINKALGLPFSRPFLGLKAESQVFPSINFTSDGSGLLDSTYSDWGVVPFSEQLKQLREFSMKISKKNLNDFVVVISSGGNDIAANLQNIMDVDLEGMLMSLEKGLQQLYEYGFRKIIYSSVGPLGCSPIVTSGGNCELWSSPSNPRVRSPLPQKETDDQLCCILLNAWDSKVLPMLDLDDNPTTESIWDSEDSKIIEQECFRDVWKLKVEPFPV